MISVGDEIILKNTETNDENHVQLVRHLPRVKCKRLVNLRGDMEVVERIGEVLHYVTLNSPIGQKLRIIDVGVSFIVNTPEGKIQYKVLKKL